MDVRSAPRSGQTTAEAAVIAAGLTVGTITTANSDAVPAGDVISQNPAAGVEATEGSAVDLVVSLGPVLVSVPDVVGLARADAEAAIVGANLTVGNVTTANSATVPTGDVISQSPAAGTQILLVTNFRLYDVVTMPEVFRPVLLLVDN